MYETANESQPNHGLTADYGLHKWLVVTPAYDVVVPVLDYGQGPIERECDVVEVDAATARDAITLGVKIMLRQRFKWCEDQRSDGCSPFAGVRAERLDDGE